MAYDKEIESIVFSYLDGNDYDTFQDKYDFFLVNQKDPDYFDFRYNFEKKTLEFHDNVIRELKKYFRLRYADADYLIEKWFIQKYGFEVEDNIKPWVTTFRIYRDRK